MEKLKDFFRENKIEYKENELMSVHTTFKIGGPARIIVFPASEDEISSIVKMANAENVRYIVIGNGSNLLVSDDGIDGLVICLGSNFSEVKLIDESTIFAQSGASLMKVCRFAHENSLSGLEFAFGIPGSCGGAAFMNAGAYGGEMKDIMYRCDHISPSGEKGFLEDNDLDLSYRHSAYYSNGSIVTGVYLKLTKGDSLQIMSKMTDLMSRRKEKQPIEYPSAGSTFKRPEGYFAAALIEEAGLKGLSVGGAQVSEKHSGFVINTGNATCKDVLELCEKVKNRVFENNNVNLEMEIRVTK